jgi:iron complex transport system ATP-binding protein
MLAADGLGFRFGAAGPWLFRGLTFSLEPGRTLALLGPNGRGKTTLLKCLGGLLRPAEGRVRRDGSVGYVPQQFVSAFAYTVGDVVTMGRAGRLGIFQSPSREDRRIAAEALAMVGMSAFAGRTVTTLSGGERQMVVMARALASGAEVMLLDEPTAALDFRNQARLLAALRRVAAERRLTVVMTSHDPAQALEVADRALLLHGAGDHEEGPAAAMLTGERLSRLYGVAIRAARLDGDGHATIAPDYRAAMAPQPLAEIRAGD